MDVRSFFCGVFLSFFVFILYLNYFSELGVNCSAQAVFSPESEDEIIELILGSNESIDLEMYVFTSERVARALGDVQARGVTVRVILEQRTNSYNLKEIVAALQEAGVEVRWASFEYKLTHSKMMVIDGEQVFVGSTNFSNSALGENREMAVVLTGEIVSEFIYEFEKDWEIGVEVEK